LVLQHLRESFSLSQGETTTYRFLLIRYTTMNPSQYLFIDLNFDKIPDTRLCCFSIFQPTVNLKQPVHAMLQFLFLSADCFDKELKIHFMHLKI
ncbi:TPA: hypothetical protein ACSEI0_002028, partial [Neisseria meningitidis]